MKENSSKNKSLLLGTIVYAIGNFGTKFLSFLIVPLYTYYISPSDLGDYDLLTTTINLITPLLTMQISDAAYRWMINDKKYIKDCISTTYQVIIVNCSISIAFLLILNCFFPIYYCYYFIAILVLGRILGSIQKLLRGLNRQKLYAISGIVYTGVFVSLNVILICCLNKGVEALLQSSVVSNLVAIGLIFLCEKRLVKVNIFGNFKTLKKDMLKYSAPLVPTTLNWWIMNASDRYIIKIFLGSAANGIYAVSNKFPSILSTVFLMFNNSLTDMVLASTDEENEDRIYYSNVFKQMYILGFSMILVIAPFTKLICNIILSSSYQESSIYISFLYLGTIFQAFSSFYSVGYLKEKKTGLVATTSIYGAIINFIVNIVFINVIGLHAAAISTFLGFFVMWMVRVIQTNKFFYIKIDWNKFLLLFAIALTVCIINIWSSNIIDIVLLAVGIIIFLVFNKDIIKGVLKKILGRIRKVV